MFFYLFFIISLSFSYLWIWMLRVPEVTLRSVLNFSPTSCMKSNYVIFWYCLLLPEIQHVGIAEKVNIKRDLTLHPSIITYERRIFWNLIEKRNSTYVNMLYIQLNDNWYLLWNTFLVDLAMSTYRNCSLIAWTEK